jgi:hypothetical protein
MEKNNKKWKNGKMQKNNKKLILYFTIKFNIFITKMASSNSLQTRSEDSTELYDNIGRATDQIRLLEEARSRDTNGSHAEEEWLANQFGTVATNLENLKRFIAQLEVRVANSS